MQRTGAHAAWFANCFVNWLVAEPAGAPVIAVNQYNRIEAPLHVHTFISVHTCSSSGQSLSSFSTSRYTINRSQPFVAEAGQSNGYLQALMPPHTYTCVDMAPTNGTMMLRPGPLSADPSFMFTSCHESHDASGCMAVPSHRHARAHHMYAGRYN